MSSVQPLTRGGCGIVADACARRSACVDAAVVAEEDVRLVVAVEARVRDDAVVVGVRRGRVPPRADVGAACCRRRCCATGRSPPTMTRFALVGSPAQITLSYQPWSPR